MAKERSPRRDSNPQPFDPSYCLKVESDNHFATGALQHKLVRLVADSCRLTKHIYEWRFPCCLTNLFRILAFMPSRSASK